MAVARRAPFIGKSKSQRSVSTAVQSVFEPLESRQLLSGATLAYSPAAVPGFKPNAGTATPTGYTPAQIRKAYGFDQITGDGTGQTIAIVDAYRDPTIVADLHAFDLAFGLSDPTLTILGQSGKALTAAYNLDPAGGWPVETALDVEWAHAVAPGANIVLVESVDAFPTNLYAAVNTARYLPGVSVVSMSFGGRESNASQGFRARDDKGNFVFDYADSYYDRFMLTPAGHQPETFIASSGDFGVAAASFPATSGNVLSIGGTRLKLDSSNNYSAEGVWIGSQGGESLYEPTPAYQSAVTKTLNRSTPDVAYDADPETGVSVYNTTATDITQPIAAANAWQTVGGTSMGSPQWAGFIADTNQLRVGNGLDTLNGVNETLPAMYQLALGKKTRYLANFNDVAIGQNGDTLTAVLPPFPIPLSTRPAPGNGGYTGLAASGGYDMVTGLGSPKVPALSAYLAVFVPVKHVHRSSRRTPVVAVATPSAKVINKSGVLSYSADVAFFDPASVAAVVSSSTPATTTVAAITPVGTPAAYAIQTISIATPSAAQGVLADSHATTTPDLSANITITPARSLALDGSRFLLTTTTVDQSVTSPTPSPDAASEPSAAPQNGSTEPSTLPPATEDGSIEVPVVPAVTPVLEAIAQPEGLALPAVSETGHMKLKLPMMLGAVAADAILVGQWFQRRAAKRRKAASPFGMILVTPQDEDEPGLC